MVVLVVNTLAPVAYSVGHFDDVPGFEEARVLGEVARSGEARSANRPVRRSEADEQRVRILRCVVKLVGVRGFEKVRLRDVATEAGVSIGSLQHYFDTRDGLMGEAFSYQGERVIRELERAAASGVCPWERIRSLIRYATGPRGFRERCTVWLEFSAASSRDPHLRRVMERVYEGWRAPLRAAVDEGCRQEVFRPAMPVADVVDTILALIDGFELGTAGRIKGFNGSRAHDVVLSTVATLLGVSDGAPAGTGDGG